eukprot:5462298-Prymnesium_polylepis.2
MSVWVRPASCAGKGITVRLRGPRPRARGYEVHGHAARRTRLYRGFHTAHGRSVQATRYVGRVVVRKTAGGDTIKFNTTVPLSRTVQDTTSGCAHCTDY